MARKKIVKQDSSQEKLVKRVRKPAVVKALVKEPVVEEDFFVPVERKAVFLRLPVDIIKDLKHYAIDENTNVNAVIEKAIGDILYT